MMKDTVYTVGGYDRWEDVLDFGNYVFSNASQPHDFRRLLPKVYGTGEHRLTAPHYLALQDHKIRGMMALLPQTMCFGADEIRTGFVGTVSVHPYSRGEGHMKRLMAMLLEDARKSCDLLILGGQRQRYNYFGFENAGQVLRYGISSTNVRHGLKQADAEGFSFTQVDEGCTEALDFIHRLNEQQPVFIRRPRLALMDILRSWSRDCHLIRKGGAMVGYIVGTDGEIRLTDEQLLPGVIKAWMAWRGADWLTLRVLPWEQERMALLTGLCESCSVSHCDMVQILCWPRVLGALLRLKAVYTPLMDGRAVLQADGGVPMVLEVKNGIPSVTEDASAKPDVSLTGLEAHRLIFGESSLFRLDPLWKNWFPLPFWISDVDGF